MKRRNFIKTGIGAIVGAGVIGSGLVFSGEEKEKTKKATRYISQKGYLEMILKGDNGQVYCIPMTRVGEYKCECRVPEDSIFIGVRCTSCDPSTGTVDWQIRDKKKA